MPPKKKPAAEPNGQAPVPAVQPTLPALDDPFSLGGGDPFGDPVGGWSAEDAPPPPPKKGKRLSKEDLADTPPGEVELKEELSETLKAFNARAAAEDARRGQATDTEYWFCVVFPTMDHREEFLAAITEGVTGSPVAMEVAGACYVDGVRLAELMKIPLSPPVEPRRTRTAGPWVALGLIPEGPSEEETRVDPLFTI